MSKLKPKMASVKVLQKRKKQLLDGLKIIDDLPKSEARDQSDRRRILNELAIVESQMRAFKLDDLERGIREYNEEWRGGTT